MKKQLPLFLFLLLLCACSPGNPPPAASSGGEPAPQPPASSSEAEEGFDPDTLYAVSSPAELSEILAEAIGQFASSVLFDLSPIEQGQAETEAHMTMTNAYFDVLAEWPELKYAYQLTFERDGETDIYRCFLHYMPYKLGLDTSAIPSGAHRVDNVHELIQAARSGMGQERIPIAITNPGLDFDLMQWALNQAGYGYIVFTLNQDATELVASPSLEKTMEECVDAIQETFDLADRILEEMISDGMTEREKVYAAYSYLTQNVVYDQRYYTQDGMVPLESRTAYGAFKDHLAICGGFSWAFQTLLERMDVECYTVPGFAWEDHMWNLAKVDGTFYYFDTTFDRGSTRPFGEFCREDLDSSYEWNHDLTDLLMGNAD